MVLPSEIAAPVFLFLSSSTSFSPLSFPPKHTLFLLVLPAKPKQTLRLPFRVSCCYRLNFLFFFFFTLYFIFFCVTRSSVQRAATSSLPVLGLKLYPSLTSAILPFFPCYLHFVFSGFNRLLRVGVGGASLFRPFCGCSCRRLSFSLNLNLNFLPSLPPCSSLLSTTPHHTHTLSSIHPFLLCDIFFFFFFSLSIYVDPHSFPLNLPLLSCSTLLHCSFHWLRSPTRHHPRFSLQWFRDFYRGIHRVELCEKGTALFFPPPLFLSC